VAKRLDAPGLGAGANPAVVDLLHQAQRQVAAEQLTQATASLERALRIEPRNAQIWYLLAQVRHRQKQFTLAESMALKSISLARDNDSLQLRNWRLISAIRNSSGDQQGAREAEQKAALLSAQGQH
jgi:cytochrome c-type biogenesis protein CcmH/NrfG